MRLVPCCMSWLNQARPVCICFVETALVMVTEGAGSALRRQRHRVRPASARQHPLGRSDPSLSKLGRIMRILRDQKDHASTLLHACRATPLSQQHFLVAVSVRILMAAWCAQRAGTTAASASSTPWIIPCAQPSRFLRKGRCGVRDQARMHAVLCDKANIECGVRELDFEAFLLSTARMACLLLAK